MVEVNIKRLSSTALVPTRGSADAAGYDLYADIEETVCIQPHSTVKISTGIAMNIPKGYFGGIYARSGLATKQGLRPGNCVGVCDADYSGNIIVALHNDTDEPQKIYPHDRIAQLVIQPFLEVNFNVVEELEETERGGKGFGSTGN